MSTSYHHFTTEERESLLKFQVEGLKPSEMARRLKRSRSSIGRELRRNASKDGRYSAFEAERKYRQRRKRCVRKRLLDDPGRKAFVEEKLREYWSPEQIAGRLKVTGSKLQVSYSTIYRAIYAGRLEIAKKCLRRKGRKASPHDEETRGRLHGHKTIHDRPRAADTRSQFGHWEGDTVQGARGKGALATGLLRQYFPKKFDFSSISPQDLQAVVAALNSRPRKRLAFRSPDECFPLHRLLHLT